MHDPRRLHFIQDLQTSEMGNSTEKGLGCAKSEAAQRKTRAYRQEYVTWTVFLENSTAVN